VRFYTGVCNLLRTGPKHGQQQPVKMTQAICEPESDMSRRRLDICRACDKWNGSTCSICGCFTALKVRLKAEACPIGKWPAEE
jgi:hypothetical protein